MIRQHIRFPPDPLAVAKVDYNVQAKDFNPTDVALMINESYTGSALVMISETPLKSGAPVKILVGKIGPLNATIVWVKELEPKIYKLGIQYQE